MVKFLRRVGREQIFGAFVPNQSVSNHQIAANNILISNPMLHAMYVEEKGLSFFNNFLSTTQHRKGLNTNECRFRTASFFQQ